MDWKDIQVPFLLDYTSYSTVAYRHKGAILFIYAIVNFILLAEYKLYNKDIIKYLKAILY